MFLDNLKRFRANKKAPPYRSVFFTSQGKSGTYGKPPGGCLNRASPLAAVNHVDARHVRTDVYN